MVCVRMPNENGPDGFVCGFHPLYEFDGYLFEVHRYHGPCPMTRKDPSEPRRGTEMKPSTLLRAIEEAERFLERAYELRNTEAACNEPEFYCGKERSAVRRSSMDLSRVLANLRQGR